ncbi:MAG: 4-hydroxy-tetrahydrodipicolinate reductase [Elusimicrobia bacterium]|nr:4-hydroxy-tetrahydrodipicolinate reductase [Elusimicrobiota bacterium]
MSEKIRLVVCGALGRMGTRILALADADPRFQPIAGVEHVGCGAKVSGDGHTPIKTDAGDAAKDADVVIDFTNFESAVTNAKKVAAVKKPLVIGTTGISPSDQKELAFLAKTIPIVMSPNMSVGVNVLFKILADAAATLAHYDIEIVEAHHNQKTDAPSGTAMRLAEIAADASKRDKKDFMYGRQGQVGKRANKEIGVLAVRAGDIVGDHTVYLAGPGERLELVHRAHSRDAFAAGALTAAAWIIGKKPGMYSMRDVLGF